MNNTRYLLALIRAMVVLMWTPAVVLAAQVAVQQGARPLMFDKELLVFVAQHIASAIEHKRKEDALRANERRYRQMFENNRAVKLLIDPQNGAIVDANMAACDYYGYTRDEFLAWKEPIPFGSSTG